jgi:hypothetical protein
LRVLENKVLREIFVLKRQKVKIDWIKSHKDELDICIPYQILLG